MNIISFIVTITFFLIIIIVRVPIIEILKTHEMGQILLRYKKKLLIITAISISLFLLSNVIISVPIGTTGVVVNGFGIGSTCTQGIKFKNIFDDVEIIPWYSQIMALTIMANTNDSIPVSINVKVVYSIDRNDIAMVRIKYPDYKAMIEQSTRSISSDYSSKYNALDLAGSKKMDFTNETRVELTNVLSELAIKLIMFNIESINLPASYQDAITLEKSAQKEKIRIVSQAQANAESIWIIDQKLSNVSNSYLQWFYIQSLTDPDSNVKWILPYNNFQFNLGEDFGLE